MKASPVVSPSEPNRIHDYAAVGGSDFPGDATASTNSPSSLTCTNVPNAMRSAVGEYLRSAVQACTAGDARMIRRALLAALSALDDE